MPVKHQETHIEAVSAVVPKFCIDSASVEVAMGLCCVLSSLFSHPPHVRLQIKEILVEESNVQPVNSPVTVSAESAEGAGSVGAALVLQSPVLELHLVWHACCSDACSRFSSRGSLIDVVFSRTWSCWLLSNSTARSKQFGTANPWIAWYCCAVMADACQ